MKYRLHVVIFCCWLMSVMRVGAASRPTNFNDGQRWPDQPESEICGRIRDVIPRDSGRYRKILIRNTNNEAWYDNDDCRRMTSRAKSKLDVLASRVKQKWPGVHVLVRLAWTDKIDTTNPTSLHYEGRSLRLSLSDGDNSKLGLLAGFAAEAGFDWVQNTYKKSYIQASVIPDVCQTSVDLVFLLDNSGSVGLDDFSKVKEFVKTVVDFFNIGVSGTHVAVVTYDTDVFLQFKLNEYYTKATLRKAVDLIKYNGHLTYTGEALNFIRNNIFTESAGMRTDPGIPKVLVLLTDGYSNGIDVYGPAEALRNIGVNIFSIGVGSASLSELEAIASDPDKDYVFQLDSFNDLADWVDRLSAVSCSEGSLIKSCEDSITTVTSGSFKYFRTEFDVITDDRVSVEVRDKKGISHLYASATSKNPGPLDPQSIKNEDDNSPRALSVKMNGEKTLFVAVQGQTSTNEFQVSFWDNLFLQSRYQVNTKEEVTSKFVTELSMVQGSYSFHITDGNDDGVFRIDLNQPKIYTTKSLDRELASQHKLVVVAEDTNNKCHKSRTLVEINVTDENDNAPIFSNAPYAASINENAPVGHVVKTVIATDADSGINAIITYSIINGNGEGRFRIESNGDVVLSNRLDYEKTRSYTLGIKAVDGGNPAKSAQTTLDVTVNDMNESPTIQCPGNCVFTITEGSSSNMVVTTLTSSDPDTGTNCALQYEVPESVKNTFSIDSNGVVKTKVVIDRELTPQFVFFVRVKDCGFPVLSDSVKMTVNIKDVNDNKPKFDKAYVVPISENEIVGSKVVQVNAVDEDEGTNGQVKYSLTDTDSSSFIIDPDKGTITTKIAFDYEKKTKYTFTVIATDQGAEHNTGSTTVTVNILDINDNKPVFTGVPYRPSVAEDASKGTLVKTVKATDKDSGLAGQVTYSIISGNEGDAFIINPDDGNITVNSGLNREKRSSYSLVLQATDKGVPSQHSRTTMTIDIGDINDNEPLFQGLPYLEYISESTNVNEQVTKVVATDLDSGNNGKVTYSIKTTDNARGVFEIDTNGNIQLKKQLDYEKTTSYSFTVVATDGGGRNTEATVKIIVQDYNDNKPVFINDPYSHSVSEGVNVGHLVGNVKATDKDSGPRGSVTYSITNGNIGNAFSISASGAVTVSTLLDRETTDAYTLTIKATDGGSTPLFSTTTMDIDVTDINDNDPLFKQLIHSFAIDENNAKNAVVGKLGPATDKDLGINAEIGYTIVSGDPSGTFEFQSNGDLVAKVVLDREKIPSYSLVIEARDKGTPSLYSTVSVMVTVNDENDETPEFPTTAYNCQISENSAQNSLVCSVQARDDDDGKNGEVTYELVQASSTFLIGPNNGEIKTKVTLDREKKSSYSFEVLAKDGGSPSRSSKVTVNVKVLDKNDNEPVFNQTRYDFEISEDAKLSVAVGKVLATDKDEGLNSKVVYAIISGNVDNAFKIDPDSGSIQVQSDLDRETVASYVLTVKGEDKGSPLLSTNCLVHIKVKDVNDNSPVFTQQSYSGKIPEDASVDSTVLQVKATDKDAANNGQVTYSITSGSNKEHFNIDPDTGVIKTAQSLDYETISSYDLEVTASDKAASPKSTSVHVLIAVENRNDNPPVFEPSSPVTHISEGVAVGTSLVQFNATDGDGNKLLFSITSGNTDQALNLDKDSGLLSTAKKLDREVVQYYNLTVTVTDSGGKSSSRDLSVVVLDVNDNRPTFDPSSYTKTLVENTAAGAVVTVKASDNDIGDNAKISYSIDVVSSQRFTIDSSTGAISTKSPLDREKGERHVIKVTAEDAGTPSLSSVTEVVVTVSDVNDNRPYFTKDYAIKLRENTAIDETVVKVEAFDPDSGINGEVLYSLDSSSVGGDGFLTLDKGVIKVNNLIDREVHQSITLTISASNKIPYSGTPPSAKTTTTITITIEDDNDNAPVITNTVYQLNVEENSKAGSLVVDVDATDKDIGVNGEIQYEITSGNTKNAFQINENTGIVSVKGGLDREVLDEYTLSIKAKDKGTPSLFSVKDFVVKITDLDDNAPTFSATSYEVSVREDVAVNTLILQMNAIDKDIGKNGDVSYHMKTSDTFRIDVKDGKIYTNVLLDYELINEYKLVVTAKDTKHSVDVDVKINVLNVNDESPLFKPNLYEKDVSEINGANTPVITVQATDEDPFGGLTYTIESGNENNKFTLDPSSGAISLAAQLDREEKDFYNLTILVTDGGTPSLSNVATVLIRVTDINDNKPMFNTSTIQESVKENSPTNTKVLTVTATDRDIGRNAELEYSITKGNADNKFKLVSDTGELLVNGNIDREKLSSFTLEITAQDKGLPSLKSKPLRVDITVLDENDNDPEFTKSSYSRNITENLSAGTFVEEVVANDKDFGLNAKISYSIQSGSYDHFTIDKDTGLITTKVPLDREDVPSYSIIIEAKDHGDPRRMSTVTLNVGVLDVNDNSPVFNVASLVVNVTEEQRKGLLVGTVLATDSDEGVNSELQYSLTSVLARKMLEINAITGEITTLKPFDYEIKNKYNFQVTATDKGRPSLTSTADLIVNVIDIDDHCPEFSPKVYNVTVEENIATNITIVQVTATDKDFGDNKDLDYGIRDGNIAGSFRIDADKGVITRGLNLDRELSATYHLVVRAGSDYCGVNFTEYDDETVGTKLSASIADVYVVLTDVNDNAPVFEEATYSRVVTDINMMDLGRVNASDVDEGMNAEIMFSLVGVKRVNSERTLTIQATDKGEPPMMSTTELTVSTSKGINCEAMSFIVTSDGQLKVNTLCNFEPIQIDAGGALVGESITLNCVANGNVVPEYKWKRDDVELSDWSKSGEYRIDRVSHDDTGNYHCIATGIAGTIVSHTIPVFVKEKPSIVLHPKDTWAEIGKESVLHCLAKGDEPIEYSWYKNNILMSSVGDLITDQKDLVFKETIVEDAAKYYCKATNNIKNGVAVSESAQLKTFKPDSVIKLSLVVDKPNGDGSCQYFNLSDVKEKLRSSGAEDVVMVTVDKPKATCNLTACSSNPCQNEGTCMVRGTTFECDCPRGWSGHQCETDEDECASENTESCLNNGTCVNRPGSFSCTCVGDTYGKRCQFRKSTCNPSPCADGKTCYSKENAQGYECLEKVVKVKLTFKLGELMQPWADWMTPDLAKIIQNTLKKQQEKTRRRRRRDASQTDYSQCSVRIQNVTKVDGGEVEVDLILVCDTPPTKDFVCDALIKEDKASSCTGDSGVIEETRKPTQPPLEPASVDLEFIILDKEGKDIEAKEAMDRLNKTKLQNSLAGSGIIDLNMKPRSKSIPREPEPERLSTGAVAGIAVAIFLVLIVAIAILYVVIRTRRNKDDSRFKMTNRAINPFKSISKRQKIERDISMQEIKDAEARGINNKMYQNVYEDTDEMDGAYGQTFMVENEGLSPTKKKVDYMQDMEASPWYHGSISRVKAEDLLESADEGSFLVRRSLADGEFFITARGSDDEGPKFRHIAVNRIGDQFVAVCGPSTEAVGFASFDEVIDYLQSTMTVFESGGPALLLRNYIK